MSSRQPKEMNRADLLRSRRQEKQKKASKTPVTGNAVRKPKNPTVPITRKSISHVQPVTRKKNMTYVPLNKKGAEVQLPALPKIQLGWRVISGAVFLLSLAVIISFTNLNSFKVNAIRLKGNNRLTAEIILSDIDILGKSIIKIVPRDLQAKIEQRFPSIKSASLSVGLPASVNLEIIEREPVILWQQDSEEYWIDAEGVSFPIFGEAELASSVFASGNPPPSEVEITSEETSETDARIALLTPTLTNTTPEFVAAVLSIIDYVPPETALQFDPNFGLGWRDPRGWVVYFGRGSDNIDTKLAQYQTITRVLEQKNISPALISLEFLHAPYYRMEQ